MTPEQLALAKSRRDALNMVQRVGLTRTRQLMEKAEIDLLKRLGRTFKGAHETLTYLYINTSNARVWGAWIWGAGLWGGGGDPPVRILVGETQHFDRWPRKDARAVEVAAAGDVLAGLSGAPGTYTGGRIINIASMAGLKVLPQIGVYCMSKAAVVQMTKAMAVEWGRFGINVNAICPGYIDTDMVAAVPEDVLKKIISGIPVGRLGKAEEIAHAVSFLASDQCAFMTGATITMNGAQYIAG